MTIYQIVINYGYCPEATYTPLDSEVFGRPHVEVDLEKNIAEATELAERYQKRTRTEPIYRLVRHNAVREVEPYYYKNGKKIELNESGLEDVYKIYRSIDSAIEAGVLKEEK